MEWWAVKTFSGYSFFINRAYAHKEAEKEWTKVIHVREVVMTDEHLMKNIVQQSKIIDELKADNKIMRDALYIIEKNYQDGQSLCGTNCSDIAIKVLSELKAKYD